VLFLQNLLGNTQEGTLDQIHLADTASASAAGIAHIVHGPQEKADLYRYPTNTLEVLLQGNTAARSLPAPVESTHLAHSLLMMAAEDEGSPVEDVNEKSELAENAWIAAFEVIVEVGRVAEDVDEALVVEFAEYVAVSAEHELDVANIVDSACIEVGLADDVYFAAVDVAEDEFVGNGPLAEEVHVFAEADDILPVERVLLVVDCNAYCW